MQHDTIKSQALTDNLNKQSLVCSNDPAVLFLMMIEADISISSTVNIVWV